jgi:glycosyltransferase involved in cell wall biosynthesis
MSISVVLCTYNPDRHLLHEALRSLEAQTLRGFDVVVVDNNSTPPLDETELRARFRLELRVLREGRPGLTYARCTGINATSGDLIVFVDDDNRLDADYLQQAVGIAAGEPAIGHFGGIARAGLRHPIPRWKTPLLRYLGVRDHGPEPITSAEPSWGPWEPIGAGMVTRRAVARGFVDVVHQHESAGQLGRRGTALMSGEDALMARAANRLGFACSYQPALKLTHLMKPARLKATVLARTVEGHGRSYVVLERVQQRPVPRPDVWTMAVELGRRYLFRTRTEGLAAGTVSWFWDVGYFRQARRPE